MTDVGSEEEEEEPPVEENYGEAVSTPNSNSNSNPPCDYEMGEGELGEEQVLPPPKVPVDETTILSAVTPLEDIPAVCYFWSKYCKSTKSTSATGSLDREPKLPLKVRERDRNNCVFHASLSEQVSHLSLHACHFIPHAKGDDYVKRLVRNHEVPLEDQMRVVDTPLNAVCMKDTWHKYVTRAVAAILLVRSLQQDWACTNRCLIDSSQKRTSSSSLRPVLANPILTCCVPRKSRTTVANLSRLLNVLVSSAARRNASRHCRPNKPPRPLSERLPRGSATIARRPLRTPGGSRRRKQQQSSQQNGTWLISPLGGGTRNSKSLPSHSTMTRSSFFSILSRGQREWVMEMCEAFPRIHPHSCGRAHVFPSPRCTPRIPAPRAIHALSIVHRGQAARRAAGRAPARRTWVLLPRPRPRPRTRTLIPSRDNNSNGTNGPNGVGTSSSVGRPRP
ncbi:hypothetical protein DFH09DRAFT_1176879 [Mycena vulgaris]|nr:hypothetical protein DFH09DRAFT_1176879 [Mycena vulgaris]